MSGVLTITKYFVQDWQMTPECGIRHVYTVVVFNVAYIVSLPWVSGSVTEREHLLSED